MLEDFPINISTYGADIDGVFRLIYWIVNTWLVAVVALMLYFMVRYRRKKGQRAAWLPADTLRSNAWVLIPVFFVFIFDMVIEVGSAKVWAKIKEDIPAHELLVKVTARQFVWTFVYAGADGELGTDDDVESINDMHVPVNKVVRFQLESLDVLHSFWVPPLRLKQDVVPGRSIPGWFEATKAGTYELACAELCGAAHTSMKGRLIVHPAGGFEAWQAAQLEQKGR